MLGSEEKNTITTLMKDGTPVSLKFIEIWYFYCQYWKIEYF